MVPYTPVLELYWCWASHELGKSSTPKRARQRTRRHRSDKNTAYAVLWFRAYMAMMYTSAISET